IIQIAREALSNVVQHSGATRVTLRLAYAGDVTNLSVTDNGRGLDSSLPAESRRNGHGIANLQARAAVLGGSLRIVSELGAGVCLALSVPCSSSRDELELETI